METRGRKRAIDAAQKGAHEARKAQEARDASEARKVRMAQENKDAQEAKVRKVAAAHAHIQQRYLEIKQVGHGTEGQVITCIPRDAVRRALRSAPSTLSQALRDSVNVVKYLSPGSEVVDSLAEVDVLPNIPAHSFIGGFLELDHDDKIWVTMPFYAGGNLRGFCRKLGESVPVSFVWHVMIQTLQALHHVHSHNYSHGDVFDKNFMLDPAHREYKDYPNVLLCDFGRALSRLGVDAVASSPTSGRREDLVTLGDEWHRIAHKTEDTRLHDGTCNCHHYHDQEAFGDSDELYDRLMQLTSDDQVKTEAVSCDRVARELLWDMTKKRDALYAELPLAAEMFFRKNLPTDQEIEDAIANEEILQEAERPSAKKRKTTR